MRFCLLRAFDDRSGKKLRGRLLVSRFRKEFRKEEEAREIDTASVPANENEARSLLMPWEVNPPPMLL